ncbi:hypothetical protein DXT99_23475 [Pontibacter diazotrophicus]|uniref:Sensor histidine kinase n=1 Tax=Pontibacter diazotrophicus TaxID=1400979 RepID=A0A3D8L381_9BACT|nr:hypothetical protein [Pontibacter diazotrophicus]RDV11868.1 hypothetical protein DXT99_23475 [Pontibacter diazotrophicus]
MKPFDQLTPRQQFWRQNIVRFIIYGSFAVVLLWSMSAVIERQERANASAQNVEDTLIDFYRTHREQTDTAGMANYMKQHLSSKEYQLWLKMGDYSYYR